MQGLENILEEIEQREEYLREMRNVKKKEGINIDLAVGYRLDEIKEIKQIILKHMNDDWIQVDDRLPEIRDYGSIKVWMTIAYPAGNATRQGFFENGRFINLNGSQIADKIIAWKPYQKPEPYQENRNS